MKLSQNVESEKKNWCELDLHTHTQLSSVLWCINVSCTNSNLQEMSKQHQPTQLIGFQSRKTDLNHIDCAETLTRLQMSCFSAATCSSPEFPLCPPDKCKSNIYSPLAVVWWEKLPAMSSAPLILFAGKKMFDFFFFYLHASVNTVHLQDIKAVELKRKANVLLFRLCGNEPQA